MFYFDRLYGELKFPELIRESLNCPGLLRLREVRMANIPFLSFPSFTGVTRYEHSLGVCHLAGIFAESAKLSEKDKIEIMLAALYHDAATPPFGHAVEEVLEMLHGYDHEEKLREIITGKTNDLGGQRTQLYLGRSLKLYKVCQSKRGRSLGLDVLRIADLAAGTQNDPLGDVICSSGIDLDNIDNVIRAATAMGIREYGFAVAESLARAFTFDGVKVCIDETAFPHLEAWKSARSALYGMIYASVEDFSLQTMLKHALHKLSRISGNRGFRETDWNLTDDQLVHQRLLKENDTEEIVIRMRLGDLYKCLAFLLIEQRDRSVHPLDLNVVEHLAAEVYKDFIGRALSPNRCDFQLPEIIVNTYPDKRLRPSGRPICFLGKVTRPEESHANSRLILGVFTPYHRNWDKKAERIFHERLSEFFIVKNLRKVRWAGSAYPTVDEVKT